jgi:hypothetical protein
LFANFYGDEFSDKSTGQILQVFFLLDFIGNKKLRTNKINEDTTCATWEHISRSSNTKCSL